jgi:hypothetical protein
VAMPYWSVVEGYSGTPLSSKLGIKETSAVAVLHAPDGIELDLPSSVHVRRQARGRADVVVAFFTQKSKLAREIDALGLMIVPSGGLWIAWPKKASKVVTDMTDHVVRDIALPLGLVDNKVCAIDVTWSGLRLVWRVSVRDQLK